MIAPDSDPLEPLRTVAALHALGLIDSWEIPPVADAMLSSGVYSDSLAEIAAITEPKMSDVAPLLARAMQECGLARPTRVDAAWTAARWCVHLVSVTPESPRKHLDVLHATVWATLNDFPTAQWLGERLDVVDLIGIQDTYHCPNENYYEAEHRVITDEAERISILDRLARQAAREWLSRHLTPGKPGPPSPSSPTLGHDHPPQTRT